MFAGALSMLIPISELIVQNDFQIEHEGRQILN